MEEWHRSQGEAPSTLVSSDTTAGVDATPSLLGWGLAWGSEQVLSRLLPLLFHGAGAQMRPAPTLVLSGSPGRGPGCWGTRLKSWGKGPRMVQMALHLLPTSVWSLTLGSRWVPGDGHQAAQR